MLDALDLEGSYQIKIKLLTGRPRAARASRVTQARVLFYLITGMLPAKMGVVEKRAFTLLYQAEQLPPSFTPQTIGCPNGQAVPQLNLG